MERVYNFSAGPSVLPEAVLKQASEEMLNYGGSGMSVMEMSHRSPVYQGIVDAAEDTLRQLMNIPDTYKVLFLQGGASTQFAMVPLNLMTGSGKADYVSTGAWSKKAIAEAKKSGEVKVLASSEDAMFNYIPKLDPAKFTADADYFFITTNNTIYGTTYKTLPETNGVPIVADMSSNILSEEINVADYGLIFAGAQKNMGPAGVTVVIIREDLVGKAGANVPTMLNYATHVNAGSMFNTPPTYSIYVAGLVFKWLLDNGGIKAMEAQNKIKAAILYDFLDGSDFFKGTVVKEDRSIMNVPFVSPNAKLDAAFIKGAGAKGLVNLKGHRSVGGMRASIYNAMPVEGVQILVDYMKTFEAANI